ncbi:hypothetical protein [Thioclava nitratireducens]|uniref:hypothetical protein n=1 Tax=Thioclava nitratireducens TaxID=1915078 RepID=UPI0024816E68|nr:hypothetical protein [Thioclava nitratireducens]WGT50410.1 hypothetical protein P0N61_19285 [Thioclava nitratireducens]
MVSSFGYLTVALVFCLLLPRYCHAENWLDGEWSYFDGSTNDWKPNFAVSGPDATLISKPQKPDCISKVVKFEYTDVHSAVLQTAVVCPGSMFEGLGRITVLNTFNLERIDGNPDEVIGYQCQTATSSVPGRSGIGWLDRAKGYCDWPDRALTGKHKSIPLDRMTPSGFEHKYLRFRKPETGLRAWARPGQ